MQKSDHNRDGIFNSMIKLLNIGWHQGSFARDALGNAVQPEDPMAVSFDVMGSLLHVIWKTPDRTRYLIACKKALVGVMNKIIEKRSLSDVVTMDNLQYHLTQYNDTPQRAKLEVVRLIEKAKEEKNG